MPILFIEVFRSAWALRRDRGFVTLGALLFLGIVGGGVAYWLLEGLRPLDALYLSVITLTTIGYGDPAPETAVGKVFTMAFALVGVGILLAFVSMIAEHVRRNSALGGRLGRLAAHAETGPELSPVTRPLPFGEYDLIVIGADDASRRTAVEAAAAGLRVVLVESLDALSEREAGRRAA
jgi:hypothetical protein